MKFFEKNIQKLGKWWDTLNFYKKMGVVLSFFVLIFIILSLGYNYVDNKKDEKFRKEREELIIQIEKLKTESDLKDLEIERLNQKRKEVKKSIEELESEVPKKRETPATFKEIDDFFKNRDL